MKKLDISSLPGTVKKVDRIQAAPELSRKMTTFPVDKLLDTLPRGSGGSPDLLLAAQKFLQQIPRGSPGAEGGTFLKSWCLILVNT